MNEKNFRIRNFEFPVHVPEQVLAPSKRPPFCDGCGEPFAPDESGVYVVHAVFLDGALWGVECDRCASRLKVHHLKEDEAPSEARWTVFGALGHDPEIIFF